MIDPGALVEPGRPYQVHIAPLFLEPDLRADQVFVGFSGQELRTFIDKRLDCESVTVNGSKLNVVDISDGIHEAVVAVSSGGENPGGLAGIIWLVDRLLGPGGCPWDQEQTHESLRKYLIEESYELIDAIDKKDEAAMLEELGDVILQPIMHAQMKSRDGSFDSNQVAAALVEKLIRRHPHVFGSVEAADTATVLANWDKIKAAERKASPQQAKGRLSGVPKAMPALLRALEVSKRAARAGFEWPDLAGVWEKFDEECAEVKDAIKQGTKNDQADELGDLLFTVVNLARWLKIDPEEALRIMLNRFQTRFEAMEQSSSSPLEDLSPAEWDALWVAAKASTTNA